MVVGGMSQRAILNEDGMYIFGSDGKKVPAGRGGEGKEGWKRW